MRDFPYSGKKFCTLHQGLAVKIISIKVPEAVAVRKKIKAMVVWSKYGIHIIGASKNWQVIDCPRGQVEQGNVMRIAVDCFFFFERNAVGRKSDPFSIRRPG